jgi:hypothetical protein
MLWLRLGSVKRRTAAVVLGVAVLLLGLAAVLVIVALQLTVATTGQPWEAAPEEAALAV